MYLITRLKEWVSIEDDCAYFQNKENSSCFLLTGNEGQGIPDITLKVPLFVCSSVPGSKNTFDDNDYVDIIKWS